MGVRMRRQDHGAGFKSSPDSGITRRIEGEVGEAIVMAGAEKNCGWPCCNWSKVVFIRLPVGEEIEDDLQFAGPLHRWQTLPDATAIGL